MLYTGIDLIELDRFERAVTRWGGRFLRRVFTPSELAAYGSRIGSLAARWAAKEAVAKLLGVGLRGLGASVERGAVTWTEIEILSGPLGRPTVTLAGRAAQHARQLGISSVAISLSHTRTHAIASAMALGEHTELSETFTHA